ncbi:MAG: DUF1553 domain-containing protein [Isosphaeraceae bacterium]
MVKTHLSQGFGRRVAVAVLVALGVAGSGRAADEKAGRGAALDYNRDVRPILSKNCFACHGQDPEKRAKGLRLDLRDEALKTLKSGATAIVPGNPDDSELVSRLVETDESLRMPPRKSGERLTAAEVDILKRWVAQGATYAEHWAFVKPVDRPLPKVKDSAWPRNGVDYWILTRLEKEGLKPSPEADRFTLLRRASLDLRGLPPSPKEVAAFAADTAPGAYERAVDRFLADSAYGERWARLWLDLARYADSAGYGSDPLRTIWRYRDWVIDAYNRNLPYDQFTVEQIAGDLLPNASLDQKLATAFHRNTMTNTEGGTDDEEFRVAAVKDRVDSTWQVWMGLTMGCAKCHSHKYDPLTNEEYYKFFAIFNQTADTDKPDEAPTIPAPTAEELAANQKIDAQIAALRKTLDDHSPALLAGRAKWEKSLAGKVAWTPLAATSSGDLERLPDGSLKVASNPKQTITLKVDSLKSLSALRLETIPDPGLPGKGAGYGPEGNFNLGRVSAELIPGSKPTGKYVRVELPGESKWLALAEVEVFSDGKNVARQGKASQSSTDFGGDASRAIDGKTDGDFYKALSTSHTAADKNPWWELALDRAVAVDRVVVWNRTDGVGSRLANFKVTLLDADRRPVWETTVAEAPSPSRSLAVSGRRPLRFGRAVADFSQPGLNPDDLVKGKAKPAGAWSVGTKTVEPHTLQLLLADPAPLAEGGPFSVVLTLETAAKTPNAALGRFRVSATDDATVAGRAEIPANVLAALDVSPASRTPAQDEAILAYYRTIAPERKAVNDQVAQLEKSRPKPATLPVMVELEGKARRTSTILVKGNFLNPGAKVDPGVPQAFPPLPKGAQADRLSVARWLVSPENPLTARVAVNRYWAALFGLGIVETEEDFGTQGEPPSHPELLDWLARQYMTNGWDTKAILKLMVTSATYRQSSHLSPELLAKDPRNRLLARGPRFRLEAEMVRDQALALGGLLSRKVGGPSVFPPQPEGLWQAAFNGQRTWATSPGDDKHRRALYTFWRRTVPYPSMATFDAPSREICSVKRTRTNTPLQAFVTMNDPVYVEAAQALARRVVNEGGSTPEARAKFALQLVLARSEVPPAQVERILSLYRGEKTHYAADLAAAKALATEPIGPLPAGADAAEYAAWTTVANVLLNLDAVLTKG